MKFEALYFADRLEVINPEGDVAVVTLWSKVDSVLQIFREAGINLTHTSRIAVAANLYGNGLPHMLRNLLWNPQIKRLLIVGKNLSGSREWLSNFFQLGLEEIEFLGSPAFRIKGTERIIDGMVLPSHYFVLPSVHALEDIRGGGSEDLKKFFTELPPFELMDLERIDPPALPEPTIIRFPSEPASHTIVRTTPMEAWTELVFRVFRFGHRNTVSKKTGEEIRIELLNTHVVVENPLEENAQLLAKYGFSLDHLLDYQKRIIDPFKPSDLDYTYGNRLRGYFEGNEGPVDTLSLIGERLSKVPDSRHAFTSLWDTATDTVEGSKTPCFDSAFFRRFDGKLNLTATFRTHNLMSAWPENVYGLIAILRLVAERAGMEPGSITVFSRSISIDPSALSAAEKIARAKEGDEVRGADGKWHPRMDPNGEFTVTIDRVASELVVEHSYKGMKIGEYRGKSSEEIERQLSRDCAISVISHALYLGRELARKEFQLKSERVK